MYKYLVIYIYILINKDKYMYLFSIYLYISVCVCIDRLMIDSVSVSRLLPLCLQVIKDSMRNKADLTDMSRMWVREVVTADVKGDTTDWTGDAQ